MKSIKIKNRDWSSVLGTNYPYDMGAYDPWAMLDQSQFQPHEIELILAGNAQRMLNLAPSF